MNYKSYNKIRKMYSYLFSHLRSFVEMAKGNHAKFCFDGKSLAIVGAAVVHLN
jgi:hypothetical protein